MQRLNLPVRPKLKPKNTAEEVALERWVGFIYTYGLYCSFPTVAFVLMLCTQLKCASIAKAKRILDPYSIRGGGSPAQHALEEFEDLVFHVLYNSTDANRRNKMAPVITLTGYIIPIVSSLSTSWS